VRRAFKIPRSFYDRPTLTVAGELLGKHLVFVRRGVRLSGRIVEVEAYIGEDDPACHAAPGPTRRNAVMYGPPGFSYVYLIYGMYHCINVVTEKKGFPAAILIRAAEPVEGGDRMAVASPKSADLFLLSGPGRLCRSFEDWGENPGRIICTPRIGIRKAIDHPWRFVDTASPAASGPGKK
jgi:DNA-3-methyladenine glycosylase